MLYHTAVHWHCLTDG